MSHSNSTGTQPNPRGNQSQEDLVDPLEAATRRGERTWSEFGWGAGLEPRDLRDKDPSEGGRYRARTQDRADARTPGGRRIR
jgi:hypothetical protein